jgi:type II secretory pathway component PulJ
MRRQSAGFPSRHRPGFTLIEVSALMAALALTLGMLTVILGGALRLQRASMGDLERLGALRELADQFRADVAQATEAPEHWQKESADATCLILAFSGDRHVLYLWEAKHLARFEFRGERMQRRDIKLGEEPLDVEFVRSGPGGRLLTFRLFAIHKDGARQPSAEITAALGGDLQ